MTGDYVSHPLSLIDRHFGLPEGTTRGVLVLHKTDNFPLVKEHLARAGVEVEGDTAISKATRHKWAELARELGLPQDWWMDDSHCPAVTIREL